MSKPSISIAEQVAKLTTHGLLDSDNELSSALVDHGYFRLSGYWRYYQINPAEERNTFEHGSDFRNVYDVYKADADLRNLLLEGLAELEIALRAMLTAKLCVLGGKGVEYLSEDVYVGRRGNPDKCCGRSSLPTSGVISAGRRNGTCGIITAKNRTRSPSGLQRRLSRSA